MMIWPTFTTTNHKMRSASNMRLQVEFYRYIPKPHIQHIGMGIFCWKFVLFIVWHVHFGTDHLSCCFCSYADSSFEYIYIYTSSLLVSPDPFFNSSHLILFRRSQSCFILYIDLLLANYLTTPRVSHKRWRFVKGNCTDIFTNHLIAGPPFFGGFSNKPEVTPWTWTPQGRMWVL